MGTTDKQAFQSAVDKAKSRLDALVANVQHTNCSTLRMQAEDARAYADHVRAILDINGDLLIETIEIAAAIGGQEPIDPLDRRDLRDNETANAILTEIGEWADEQTIGEAA